MSSGRLRGEVDCQWFGNMDEAEGAKEHGALSKPSWTCNWWREKQEGRMVDGR